MAEPLQTGSPEHVAKLEELTTVLTEGMDIATKALTALTRQCNALQYAFVLLAADLQRRDGTDLPALAAKATEYLGALASSDPEMAKAVCALLGGNPPAPRPQLHVIDGGRVAKRTE